MVMVDLILLDDTALDRTSLSDAFAVGQLVLTTEKYPCYKTAEVYVD